MPDWSQYRTDWNQFRINVPDPPRIDYPTFRPGEVPAPPSIERTPFSFEPLRRNLGQSTGNFLAGLFSGPFASEETWESPYGKAGAAVGSVADFALAAKGLQLAKGLLKRPAPKVPTSSVTIGDVEELPQAIKTVIAGKTPMEVRGVNRITYRGSTPSFETKLDRTFPQTSGTPDILVPDRLKPVTPAEEAFNAMIPERYKQYKEVWPTGQTDLSTTKIGGEQIPTTRPSKITFGEVGELPTKRPKEVIEEMKETVVPKPGISPLDWKDRFFDWHYARKASDFEGLAKKKEFKELDNLGMEGVFRIQAGDGTFDKVRKYFDDKFAQVSKIIPDIKYRENYLPQLWDNTSEEIQRVFGSKLSVRPSFTLQRVIEDYRTGIERGLKPKFQRVSDLVGWYEQRANKAIADREFFDYLKQTKLIVPTPKAQAGWRVLDPETFPIILGKDKRGMTWSAPPDVAKGINNVLRENTGFLAGAGKAVGFTKNIALTGGVPHTGINWHTLVNTPARSLVSGGVKRMLTNYAYDVRPSKAADYLDEIISEAGDAVRHGLNLGAEGFSAASTPHKSLGELLKNKEFKKLPSKVESWFSDSAFKKIIPALKMQSYKELYPSFVAKGMDIKSAKKAASEYVNNTYGGIDDPFRSKDTQNLLRIFLLAPDWFETKYQLGKGAAKALLDPKNPLGQKYIKTAVAMVGANIATKAMRHVTTGQAEPTASRMGNVPVPDLDISGKSAELDPFGASFETVELPMRLGADIAQGKNPLSTLNRFRRYNMSIPMQFGENLLRGEDEFGRPMGPQDRFGNEVPTEEFMANLIGELLGMVTPQPVQAPFDYATGRLSGPESVAKGLEIPVRWYRRPRR